MDDRRRYFRISDSIIVNCYQVTKEQKSCRIRELKAGIVGDSEQRRTVLGLDTQFKSVILQIREQQPEIAYALELINSRISQLSKNIDLSEEDQQSNKQDSIQVNISACGIAFDSNHKYAVGDDLALELVLCPSYTYIVIYGTVVKCELAGQNAANDSVYSLAIDYDYIHEDDRERLIHHIMKKQSEEIKTRRKARIEK